MKIRLHFNRINMQRGNESVWSAHTHQSCNSSPEVLIRHGGKIVGKTVFNPEGRQPRACVEFSGTVVHENGRTYVDIP